MTLSDPMVGAQPPSHDIAANSQPASGVTTLQQRHAQLDQFVASIRDRLTMLSQQIDSRCVELEPSVPQSDMPESGSPSGQPSPTSNELETPSCQDPPPSDQECQPAIENATPPCEIATSPNEVASIEDAAAEQKEQRAPDNPESDPLQSLNALKLRLAKQIQDA